MNSFALLIVISPTWRRTGQIAPLLTGTAPHSCCDLTALQQDNTTMARKNTAPRYSPGCGLLSELTIVSL